MINILTLQIAVVFLAISSVSSQPVRGIWFAISGTKAPYSKQGIQQVVNRCKSVGINTIYFAVWDESMTNFKLNQSFSQKYPFVKMNPAFTFDLLQYLIQAGHQAGLKVFAWFQYGFATSYNDPEGGPILKAKPKWKAIDQDGKLAQKNKFQWMNGFDPEVQNFMTDLIVYVCQNYKVDGIQGDDRMPAMPSLAGYDQYTVGVYRAQHFGKYPPTNYKDDGWVQWRASLLNDYLFQLSNIVRTKFPKLEIHMAPSVYPWSKYQYLQNWPQWVYKNAVDAILPQIYRYTISAYTDTIVQNLNQIEADKKQKFYPGILIGVGSNTTQNIKILADSLAVNRQLGLKGQSFFYHESLADPRVRQIIADSYRTGKQQQ